MERILIVEDDEAYREFLVKIISEKQYEVDAVNNPITGIEHLAQQEYDLLLSDLKMPEMDGIRLANTAKNIQPGIKTIVLTANPDEESEIASINNKIDLYMVKEKGIAVILEYIRLVLDRETSFTRKNILRSNTHNLELNKETRQVFKNGKEVEITKREFELLELLLENKNMVLSREEIIERLWEIPLSEIDSRIVDVHVKNLRDKLRIFSIATVRGYGYKWNE